MQAATFSTELNTDGLDNIIRGMGAQASQTVRTFALMVLGIAHGRAPIDTGRLQASLVPGAEENIFLMDSGPNWVQATIGTDVFYAIFQEYGTRHHRAQPFLNPAVEIVRPQFEQAVAGIVGAAARIGVLQSGAYEISLYQAASREVGGAR